MGYRDDFYISDNIIGYTGNVHEDPTVYFAEMHFDGERVIFGHITQSHPTRSNIGREMLRASKDYEIDNMDFGNGPVGVENMPDTGEFHISRSTFYWIYQCTPQQKAVLAGAIARFPELKGQTGPARNQQQQRELTGDDGPLAKVIAAGVKAQEKRGRAA